MAKVDQLEQVPPRFPSSCGKLSMHVERDMLAIAYSRLEHFVMGQCILANTVAFGKHLRALDLVLLVCTERGRW